MLSPRPQEAIDGKAPVVTMRGREVGGIQRTKPFGLLKSNPLAKHDSNVFYTVQTVHLQVVIMTPDTPTALM
jgi:hypothetical protein